MRTRPRGLRSHTFLGVPAVSNSRIQDISFATLRFVAAEICLDSFARVRNFDYC